MSGRRRFVATLGAAAAALTARRAHAADPIELQVRLEPDQIEVGQSAQLIVEMRAQVAGAEIEFEPPAGLQARLERNQFGTSMHHSLSGGVRRSTRVTTAFHVYRIFPLEPGEFKLEVAVAHPQGRLVFDPAPQLTVGGQALPTAPATQPAKDPGAPAQARGTLFAHARATPARVYVGEPLIYALEVWDRTRQRRQLALTERPTFKDFWSEELEVRGERRGRAGNQTYRVQPVIRRVLFPQRAGKLSITAATLRATPFGGFFFQPGPATDIQAPAVEVEVQPLPAKGQPPEFNAHNVGRFEISAEVDRKTISQGDGVKLTVEVAGEGNISLVEPERWPSLPGWQRFDPEAAKPVVQVREDRVRGRRAWTFLLVAQEAGSLEIPAHTIAFFDPEAETYRVARSEAIRVEVAPRAGFEAASGATGASGPSGAASGLEDDPLAEVSGQAKVPRVRVAAPWLSAARFDRIAGGMAASAALVAAASAAWVRWGPDEAARERARRAKWKAETLAAMRGSVADGGEAFWRHAAELAQWLALTRLGEGHEGRTREQLARSLREAGLEETAVEAWRAVLDRADAARFGAGAGDASEREAAARSVREMLEAEAWQPEAKA